LDQGDGMSHYTEAICDTCGNRFYVQMVRAETWNCPDCKIQKAEREKREKKFMREAQCNKQWRLQKCPDSDFEKGLRVSVLEIPAFAIGTVFEHERTREIRRVTKSIYKEMEI